MTRVLVVAVVLSLTMTAYESQSVRALKAELAASDRHARQVALGRSGDWRDELRRTAEWLHAYYQAAEGLRRPQGLCPDGRPDFDALGGWVFGMYVHERLAGASEETARQLVMEAIHHTPEWQRQHVE